MEIRGTRERASSTVEFVGIAAAVAVLLGGLSIGMHGEGGSIARAVVDRLGRVVHGDVAVEVRVERSGPPEPEFAALAVARERRWESSDDAPRVSRSDLRMNPVLPGLSVWNSTSTVRGTGPGGIDAQASASTCLVCVDAGWRDGFRTGLSTSRTFRPADGDLVNAEVSAEGRAALVGVDLIGVVQQRTGVADWKLQGRARATVGVDADGKAAARLGRDGFEVTAGAGAMAGAVVRGEARAGVDLLGIAVSTRGRAEGWAGAGARANASVSRRGSTITWDAGVGAALGLGGSVDWGGSIDTSKLATRHRTAANTTLRAAVSAVVPGASGFLSSIDQLKGH